MIKQVLLSSSYCVVIEHKVFSGSFKSKLFLRSLAKLVLRCIMLRGRASIWKADELQSQVYEINSMGKGVS